MPKNSNPTTLEERIEEMEFTLRETKTELKRAKDKLFGKAPPKKRIPRRHSEDPIVDALLTMHHSILSRHRAKSYAEEPLCAEELIAIHQRQGGKCFYTGLTYIIGYASLGKARHPLSASADRIDSTKGYTPENTVLCAWFVNAAKNAWPLDAIKPLWKHLPTD